MGLWSRKSISGYAAREESAPLEAYPELDQGVYMNLKGAKDDGSGTFTGVADALITNPADMIHWLLITYGEGVVAGDIVTSGFGAFSTARTELNDRITSDDFMIRCRLAQPIRAKESCAKIAEQSGMLFLDEIQDGKFRVVAWKASPSGDSYTYRAAADGGLVSFAWGEHIIPGTFKAEPTTENEIFNEVYVNYLYDYPRGQFQSQVYVDAATSYPNDDTREAVCADSQSRFGVIKRLTVDADFVYREAEAEWLRNFAVDTRAIPRLRVSFETWVNACDLFPGQVFGIDSGLDSHVPYPVKGSDGSWASKLFRCEAPVRSHEAKGAVRYRVTGLSV